MEFLKDKNKVFTVLFVVIILLGASLRLYKLGELSFTADEFLGVNTSYGYLKTGEWKRWDFNLNKISDDKPYAHSFFDLSSADDAEGGAYTRAWIFNWQVAQFLKIFPLGNESSFRLASALWGILTIFIIYFVAKKFTKKKEIALLSAFLFAINISAIIFDRKVRMYAMFFPVYLLFSYCLFQLIENRENYKIKLLEKLQKLTGLNFLYALPAAILGLLSFHLHLLSANIFFVLIFYFIIRAFLLRKTDGALNRFVKYLGGLIILFLAAIIIAPRMVAPFLASFQFTNHLSYAAKVLSDYDNAILAIAAMFFGTYYLCKNNKKEGLFIAVSFFVPFLFAIFFWHRVPGDQYIFFIKSFEIILIASGIYYLVEFFRKSFGAQGGKAYIISLVALLVLIPNYSYFFQENNVYNQTSRSDDPNYQKVFSYFMKNKKDGDILVSRWFRNYYFKGADISLITFGGERSLPEEKKITAARLQSIQNENPCGWFIWSDSDDAFVTADAKEYIRKNFDKIDNIQTRGSVEVDYWCNK